ncbi:DMT family transporter [Nisaea nitritireducens]|uniref:DMT family transporter n=1 Tax=Nisaea nitritireducens TaxID=568392 RepID=UPI001868F3C3|nr:DMT family transporter [Nisaea nitritireducens]
MTDQTAILVLRSRLSLDMVPPLGPRARAASFAFGAVLLWATWPTLATLASPAPPFLVFGLAAVIGFAVSFSLAALRGRAKPYLKTPPRTVAFVALALLANNALYLFAMPRIGPAEANVISYLWPVMLVLIIARLRRERLSLTRSAGIIIGFAGAALAIGPTFERGLDPGGILLAFLSGLTFAIYAAIRTQGREAQDVIGPSMGLLAVMALSAHALFEAPIELSQTQWLAIVGIGIAPLTLSNALWDQASRTGRNETALISGIAYMTPLASLFLLALFDVTPISSGVAVGAVLVVIGALAASNLLSRRGCGS